MNQAQDQSEDRPQRKGGFRTNLGSMFEPYTDNFGLSKQYPLRIRGYIIAAIGVYALLSILEHRYTVVASGNGALYRLNNFTGNVSICGTNGCRSLPEKEPL